MRRTFRHTWDVLTAGRQLRVSIGRATPLVTLAGVLLLATAGAAAAGRTASLHAKKAAATRKKTAAVVTVKLRGSSLHHKVLVDSRGRTLYLFTHDAHGKSACYGACAKVWPPLLVSGKSRAVGGAKQALLGRTKRKNGMYQLTYHGHPVYLFMKDTKAGQAKGEGIDHFGGHWYAVSAAGVAIMPKATATQTKAVSPKNAAVTISTRVVKGLGPILVNSKGLTLYMFVPDKDKKVTCVSTCAALWPPVFLPKGDKISNSVAVTGKAKASLLGVDKDPAGGRVLTYKGWPLYTYVADTKPGMTTGQALYLNKGLWYVLNPSGKVLKKKVRIST